MTSIPHAMADTPSAENSPAKPMESKRIRYFELCLVLLVALSTPFLNSVLLLVRGPSALGQISSFRWINGSLHEIIALALLGYVLARRGRRFRDLGLQWSARDCGVGLIVAVVSYISYLAVGIVLQSIHFALVGDIATRNSSQAFFGHPGLPAVPYSLLNPFFEELIVRAYLMAEILELTGSSALAIAVSVLVQTSYHLYYGWFGAACLAFPFLVFALYFARYRRALPVIVAHEVWDLIGLIRLW
jgi:membrane protease YdiL (CAAX protease family)